MERKAGGKKRTAAWQADLAGMERRPTLERRFGLKATEGPDYRFFLNLYSTPTEMAKLTSVWVILGG